MAGTAQALCERPQKENFECECGSLRQELYFSTLGVLCYDSAAFNTPWLLLLEKEDSRGRDYKENIPFIEEIILIFLGMTHIVS